MKRAVHVHIHRGLTADNAWEESKHPRKDDGKFGTGSGDKKESGEKKDGVTKEKKPTKRELRSGAAKEWEAANKGKGSYQKAAEMYEAAGEPTLAAGARALAKRHGHDKAGQDAKSKADLAAAAKVRKEADAAEDKSLKVMLQHLAEAYEERVKNPEDNSLTQRINLLKDNIAFAERSK